MANLFAFRATEPSEMKSQSDPIGVDNDEWLAKLAKDAGVIVAAWGNDGSYLNRSNEVKNMLSNLHYLKINKSGEPAHPLYLKADLKPVPIKLGHVNGCHRFCKRKNRKNNANLRAG